MKIRFLALLTCLISLFLVFNVNAASLTVYDLDGSNASMTYDGTAESVSVGYGEIQTKISGYNGLPEFYSPAYCVEIDEPIWSSVFNNAEFMSLDNWNATHGGNTGGVYSAAWLMDRHAFSDGFDDSSRAALQMLIWEILYGDDFSFTGSTDNDVNTYYDAYLSDYKNYNPDSIGAGYMVAHLTSYETKDGVNRPWDVQDLIVRVAPVPEPATFILMGVGLVGISRVTKKKLFKA